MRLGQLSRLVNVSQKDIISTLKKEKGVELKVHPNIKIEDEFSAYIVAKYVEKATESNEEELPTQEKGIFVKDNAAKSPTTADEVPLDIDKPIEKIETVIPKIEGIKIVGKIDLPQFHIENTVEDSIDNEQTESNEPVSGSQSIEKPIELPNATPLFKSRKRPANKKRTRKPSANKKSAISEAELKEKEVKLIEKKRLVEAKDKKKRAQKKHLELVKSYPSNKKTKSKKQVKSTDKTEDNLTTTKTATKKAPKTALGRFWKWMNTE